MTGICPQSEIDTILFANDDWSVVADGLEHHATGCFIARSGLAARYPDGLWTWPLQLAEKSWYAPRSFREAFTRALDIFGVASDEHLSRSFAVGSDVQTKSSQNSQDGFVSLASLVRPRSNERKRPAVAKTRVAVGRHTPMSARTAMGSVS